MRFLIKRNSRRNVTGATLACVVLALHAVVPLGTTHAEGAAEQDVPLVQTSYSGSPDARGNREGVARPNQLLLGKGLHPPSVACSWSVQARARTHLQKKNSHHSGGAPHARMRNRWCAPVCYILWAGARGGNERAGVRR